MNTRSDSHSIEVRGVPVRIVRKRIKNMYIGVHPPHGHVRVSVPLGVDVVVVRLAVISRLNWIRRKRSEFAEQGVSRCASSSAERATISRDVAIAWMW